MLKDTGFAGSYQKAEPIVITSRDLAALLLEAALLATPDGRAPLNVLLGSPAFFPFHLPAMRGETLIENGGCLKVIRYWLDDELLALPK